MVCNFFIVYLHFTIHDDKIKMLQKIDNISIKSCQFWKHFGLNYKVKGGFGLLPRAGKPSET